MSYVWLARLKEPPLIVSLAPTCQREDTKIKMICQEKKLSFDKNSPPFVKFFGTLLAGLIAIINQ